MINVNHQLPLAGRKYSIKLGEFVLNSLGWQIKGELPQVPKVIFAVAPHTSNWDFIIAIAAMLKLDLNVKFMGKAAIFVWPIKNWLLNLGGIPIERSASHGVVQQMVDKFNQHEQLILGLAPEGTRSKTAEWKTGFLHIAHQANVPVVPVSLHFGNKEIRFHLPMEISEDIASELQRVKTEFKGACAKNPQAV